jgi:putative transposase
VFAYLAGARVLIARRRDDNDVRPHSAHGGLTPKTTRSSKLASDRLRNSDHIRRSPAIIAALDTA